MGPSDITLQAYFERVLVERDKFYTSQFAAQEKAVLKAENSQNIYNTLHNDLIRKGEEQRKELYSRNEAYAVFKAWGEKFSTLEASIDTRLEMLRTAIEKNTDAISKEIADLRESRSELVGGSVKGREIWGYLFGGIGIILAVIFHFMPK